VSELGKLVDSVLHCAFDRQCPRIYQQTTGFAASKRKPRSRFLRLRFARPRNDNN